MASCKVETQKYRQCLKDSGSSGCGRSCLKQAKTLEACRQKWRAANQVQHEFDGRRILPNKKCQLINKEVQKCMKWKGSDQSKCQTPIEKLKICLEKEEGIVAPPTEGDKIWSDYKGN